MRHAASTCSRHAVPSVRRARVWSLSSKREERKTRGCDLLGWRGAWIGASVWSAASAVPSWTAPLDESGALLDGSPGTHGTTLQRHGNALLGDPMRTGTGALKGHVVLMRGSQSTAVTSRSAASCLRGSRTAHASPRRQTIASFPSNRSPSENPEASGTCVLMRDVTRVASTRTSSTGRAVARVMPPTIGGSVAL